MSFANHLYSLVASSLPPLVSTQLAQIHFYCHSYCYCHLQYRVHELSIVSATPLSCVPQEVEEGEEAAMEAMEARRTRQKWRMVLVHTENANDIFSYREALEEMGRNLIHVRGRAKAEDVFRHSDICTTLPRTQTEEVVKVVMGEWERLTENETSCSQKVSTTIWLDWYN